ncbi:MAG: GspH/FimT family pseudopilin [Phycisphaeraceae bacterium]|nr:GspH/FimT family pseudopilin [Phycisphaeraceae bacterium]
MTAGCLSTRAASRFALRASREAASRARRGFSLFELVVVASIMAVMAAIAIPRFGRSVARARASGGANRLAADLRLARELAMTRSASVTMTFDAVNDSYTMTGVINPITGSGTLRVELDERPYLSQLGAVSVGGDTSLVFDMYGAPDSIAIFTVVGQGITKLIQMDAAGTVTISEL